MAVDRLQPKELGTEEVSELIDNMNATVTETNEQTGGLFEAAELGTIHTQMVALGVSGSTFEAVSDRLERWATHIDNPTKLKAARSERELMIRMAVELSEEAFDLLLQDFWSPKKPDASALREKCSRLQAAQAVFSMVSTSKILGARDALRLLHPDEDLNFPDLAPNFEEDDELVNFLDPSSDGENGEDIEAGRLQEEAEHRNWLRAELTALVNEVGRLTELGMLTKGEANDGNFVLFDPQFNAFVSSDESEEAIVLIEREVEENFIIQFHPSLRGLMRTKFGRIVRALLAPITSEKKLAQVREKYARQIGRTAGGRFAEGMVGAETKDLGEGAIFVPAKEDDGFFDVVKKALMLDKDGIVDELISSMDTKKVGQKMAEAIHGVTESMRVESLEELTDGTQFENWTGNEIALFSLLEDEAQAHLFDEVNPQCLTVLAVTPEGLVITDNPALFYEQAKAKRGVLQGVFSINRDSAEDTAGISELARMYKFKPEAKDTLAKLKLSLMSDLVIYKEVLKDEGDIGIGAGTVLRESSDRVEALNRTTFVDPYSGREIDPRKTLDIFSLLEYAPRSTEENEEYQLRANLAGVSVWTADGTRVVESIPFRGDIYRDLAMTIFRHKDTDHTDISIQAMEAVVMELSERLKGKGTAQTSVDKKVLAIEEKHGVNVHMDPVTVRQGERKHASIKSLLELRYPGKLSTQQLTWVAEALEAYPREITEGLSIVAQIGEENPGHLTRTAMSYGRDNIEILLIPHNEDEPFFKFCLAHEVGHHLQRSQSHTFGEVEEIYQVEPKPDAELIKELTTEERKKMRKRLKKAGYDEFEIQCVLLEFAASKLLMRGMAQVEGGIRNFPTDYSLSGGPDEYFAEACALWVCDPNKFDEMKNNGAMLSTAYFTRLEQALREANVEQRLLSVDSEEGEDDHFYRAPRGFPNEQTIFTQILVNEIGFSDSEIA